MRCCDAACAECPPLSPTFEHLATFKVASCSNSSQWATTATSTTTATTTTTPNLTRFVCYVDALRARFASARVTSGQLGMTKTAPGPLLTRHSSRPNLECACVQLVAPPPPQVQIEAASRLSSCSSSRGAPRARRATHICARARAPIEIQ